MEKVTIITPTYNRAELLRRLYRSLEQQTKKDFMWLIVDDGSTDHTEETVKELLPKASFEIGYIWKDNGGKHTALNVGIKIVRTELIMIVDSDDQLLPNAVEEIGKVHDKYKINKEVGVYSFLRCYLNGEPIISLDKDGFVGSYVKYRIKENRPGDMAEVFKTAVLKEFPFPEFPGEKFLSEDVVWIQIGLKYKFAFINKAIYQCEYLEGGLTANDKPMKFASPLGSMMRGKMLMCKECGIKQNLKGAIIYDCYKINATKSQFDRKLKLNLFEKFICAMCEPLSLYYYMRWRKR